MLCVFLEDVLLGFALLFTGFVTARGRNAFVAVGDDVRLNCSTTDLTSRVKWERTLFSRTGYQPSESLYNTRGNNTFKTTNETMSVTTVQSGNKQHLDLIITRTNSSDAGSYNCEQISGSLASHRLVVVDTSANCRTNLSASKVAKEGDTIRLACSVEYSGDLSNLEIEVGLKSSSGNILINNSSSNSNQSNVTAHFSLVITTVLLNEVRCYTRVSGDGESETFDGSVCGNITLHKKPRNITFHPVIQEYKIGDQVTCRADGNPPPQYEWFDQWNRSIANGSMVTVPDGTWFDANGFNITISNWTWLTCVARNDLGTTSANITIEVAQATTTNIIPSSPTSTNSTDDKPDHMILIASMVSLGIFAVCLVVAVIIVKKRMSSSALLEKPDVVSSSTSNSDSTNPNTLNNSTSYDLRTGSNTIGSTSTSDYLENEARAPRPSHEATPFPTYAEVNKSRVADRRSFIRPMPSVGNVLNRPALIDNVEYAVVNKPKKPSNDMEMGPVGSPARRHDDCNEMQASDRGNPKDKKSKKKPPAAARNNPLEMQGDDGTIYSILNVRKPNATTVPMANPKQKPEGRSRIVIADPNSEYASVDHRMNSIPPPPPPSSRH